MAADTFNGNREGKRLKKGETSRTSKKEGKRGKDNDLGPINLSNTLWLRKYQREDLCGSSRRKRDLGEEVTLLKKGKNRQGKGQEKGREILWEKKEKNVPERIKKGGTARSCCLSGPYLGGRRNHADCRNQEKKKSEDQLPRSSTQRVLDSI